MGTTISHKISHTLKQLNIKGIKFRDNCNFDNFRKILYPRKVSKSQN